MKNSVFLSGKFSRFRRCKTYQLIRPPVQMTLTCHW